MILPENEVHVFVTNLEHYKSEIVHFQNLLITKEVNNSNRFYSQIDKESYILRYGIYRTILSNYLNLHPTEILIKTTESGKPFVENYQINFSFSSSHPYCAIALVKNTLVGVDIEILKNDSEYRQMANMFFSKAENKFLDKISNKKLAEAFLKIWTAKEAFIKANKVVDPAYFSISFSHFPNQFNTLVFEGKSWYFYENSHSKELITSIAADKPNLIIKEIEFNLLSFPKK